MIRPTRGPSNSAGDDDDDDDDDEDEGLPTRQPHT